MQSLSLLAARQNFTVMPVMLVLISALSSSLEAVAREPDNDAWHWGLGVGAISNQKSYAGIDHNTMAMPLFFFENKYLHVFGPKAELKLPGVQVSEDQQLNFSMTARYDFGQYDKDDIKDTPVLQGMDERKGGLWAGAKAAWTNPVVDVGAEWQMDASGDSEGQRFKLGLEKTWRLGEHVMLTPRLEANWLDKNYVDYYYGVRQNEARTGRPAYTGKATANLEYGMRGVYMFASKHAFFLDVGVKSLGKEIKDSPLVDSATEHNVLFGYTYRFQ